MRDFLKTFQADRSMAVFLLDEMMSILKELLSRVLTDSALAAITSGNMLVNVDLTILSSNSTLKNDANVCIGSAAVAALEKLKTADEPKKSGFYADVKSFILQVSEKLIEKFPLKFKYTGAIPCFSPILMATNSKVAASRAERLFQMIFEDGHISSDVAHKSEIIQEFAS